MLDVLKVQAAAYSIEMLNFLPTELQEAIKKTGYENLYEIRMRKNCPVTASFRGKYVFLGKDGVCKTEEKAFVCGEDEISETIYRAGNFSVYAVEEQLRRGFVTAEGGVRIGIAGEYAFENGRVIALKEVRSLCIRLPHRMKGAGSEIYSRTLENGLKNVLIVSAPGRGKTTILRDIAERLAEKAERNLFVCDERGEIAVGGALKNADVLAFVDKKQAFEMAIRAMRPDVIITDELSEEDCAEVRKAKRSGVYVVATAHFENVSALPAPFLGTFDRYAVLESGGIGKIAGIYDKDLHAVKG